MTARKTSGAELVHRGRYRPLALDVALVPEELERNIQCRFSAEEPVEMEELKLEVVAGC